MVSFIIVFVVGFSFASMGRVHEKVNEARSHLRELGVKRPDEIVVFKKPPEGEPLYLSLFRPEGGAKGATIIFFHGGGWLGGNPKQFFPHCNWLASNGYGCISASYRTAHEYGTSPLHAVEDANDAFRYVQSHQESLGFDSSYLFAGGGSAGGHLATSLVTYSGHNISPVSPAGLVLFNPVIDNSSDGYGYERVKFLGDEFSPIKSIVSDFPPTLILSGSDDVIVPAETIYRFSEKLSDKNVATSVKIYSGAKHGFFNKDPFFVDAMHEISDFLERVIGGTETRMATGQPRAI
ncbi:alpha/beta hydrolase [uncultured Martelella sp.]|uniref:alpha/beta hydrolase n=1 Tax=uncultured Martelella sp. TaxID=392331 RepID=UPI0029C8A63F|nr:alpha/beta hydrolase [uncultured Martelella sp.]